MQWRAELHTPNNRCGPGCERKCSKRASQRASCDQRRRPVRRFQLIGCKSSCGFSSAASQIAVQKKERASLRARSLRRNRRAGGVRAAYGAGVRLTRREIRSVVQFPALSGDGRFIAFISAPASAAGGGNAQPTRIYVRDTCAGPTANSACAPTTITVGSNGGAPDADEPVAISEDGRYVVFAASAAVNAFFQPTASFDGTAGRYMRRRQRSCRLHPQNSRRCDRARWIIAARATILSHPSAETGDSLCSSRAVAGSTQRFRERAFPDVFLRDTCLGQTAPNGCVASTALVASNATRPSIDAAGRYITYVAADPTTSAASANLTGALYVYDTCVGATSACTPATYPTTAAGREFIHDCAHKRRRKFCDIHLEGHPRSDAV